MTGTYNWCRQMYPDAGEGGVRNSDSLCAHYLVVAIAKGGYHAGEDHNYVLFNPFHDRSPERAAAAYLDAMRRGDCKNAERFTANVILPNRFTCEQLHCEYRNVRNLFVQRLRDRRKDGSVVVLYYSNSGYEGNWVAVRQPGGEWGGNWRVLEFNKIW